MKDGKGFFKYSVKADEKYEVKVKDLNTKYVVKCLYNRM